MDSEPKTVKKRKFTKRSHRPWEGNLLEAKVDTPPTKADDSNTKVEVSETASPVYTAELAEDIITEHKLEKNDAQKDEIVTKQEQDSTEVDQLSELINDTDDESLLIGGVFRPHLFATPHSQQKQDRLHNLLDQYNKKTQEIESLATDLKLLEAQESEQKAEQARVAEHRLRMAAEERVKEAIEKAKQATSDLHAAMQQAMQAEDARKVEAKLREEAEHKLEQLKLEYENLSKNLHSTEQQRSQVANKAELSLNKLVELEKLLDESRRECNSAHRDAEQSKQQLQDLENRLNRAYEAIEDKTQENTDLTKITNAKIEEQADKIEKLKKIIQQERLLRRDSEEKIKEIKVKAQVTQKRAQAMAKANKTIMQFLNSPVPDADGLDFDIDEAEFKS